MQNLYKKKNVLLIGPAPEAFYQEIVLNQYDFVVRLNNSFPISKLAKEKTGKRCEIYYPNPSYLRHRSHLFDDEIIQHIRINPEEKELVNYKLKNKVSFYNFDVDQYTDKIGCRLNIGMCAILDIFLGNPASFFITGITFFQSENPYHPGYTNSSEFRIMKQTKGDLSGHNQFLQWKYFSEHIQPFVQTDDVLRNISIKV